MSLKQVKIAGFKSFVDPTTVKFPSNKVAIIGPNGCGKSNIIDAVRWVMGESSAKTLRGESMADVIFSGSANRQPVGLASVELLFDNASGRFGGEYADYAEIAIRREVTRDGTSNYFLNGTKCRRRDIIDIFLGTGLGPRSYAIIGQGMIARIIEAKPDDLRIYLEEAAGISKYKERRRETENRIRHTRENLARLSDLRDELQKQLERLQRQAKAAARYKEYKHEQRQLKSELCALKWKNLQQQRTNLEHSLQKNELDLEAKMAELRRLDNAIEQFRDVNQTDHDAFNKVQEQYYKFSAEISRIEERIAAAKERRQQLQEDLHQAERSKTHAQTHRAEDETKIATLKAELAQIEPQFRASELNLQKQISLLERAEQAVSAWQEAWDEFNEEASKALQAAEVQQRDIQHIEQHQQQHQQRLDHLQQQLSTIDFAPLNTHIAELDTSIATAIAQEAQYKSQLDQASKDLQLQRHTLQDLQQELADARRHLQQQQGRQASLDALQQVALGHNDQNVKQWLESKGLAKHKRLAQTISVTSGWEQAVELILGEALQAICLDEVTAIESWLPELQQKSLALSFFNNNQTEQDAYTSSQKLTPLLTKVQATAAVKQLLAGVYVASDLAEAYQIQTQLAPHESVVTQSGICLRAGLVYMAVAKNPKAGVLQREQELETLAIEIDHLDNQVEQFTQQISTVQQAVETLESRVHELQSQLAGATHKRSNQTAELRIKHNQKEQLSQRQAQLELERKELLSKQEEATLRLSSTREQWQQNLQQVEQHAHKKTVLQTQKTTLNQTQQQQRMNHVAAQSKQQQLSIRQQTLHTEMQLTQQNLTRIQDQLAGLAERHDSLMESFAESQAPMVADQKALDAKLEQQLDAEQSVSAARQKLEQSQQILRQTEQQREQVDQDLASRREAIQQQKMSRQTLEVKQTTLLEQLAEIGLELKTVLDMLSSEANESHWMERLTELDKRIQGLGAINLAAIEEYETESERKRYLDEQNEDLEQALKTLENAIHKIDKETRSRFKETFDKVDQGLQNLFPRLFGGGEAKLELTGNDLLDTGVNIIAKPPGKRNSSIHLLSGGEKALTAVALVFAIFQLNPSPFCMLDEVDAPLDDANVNRFCDMVRSMSEQVQFIFITHNKITMELANQLMGVTMHEPGVSRMVSVDIEKAVTMAESVN